MELDSLKEIWKLADVHTAPQKTNRQILEMIGKQSNGPIAKMKRNLVRELVVLLVGYIPMTIYYSVKWQGTWSEVSWAYIVIALAFFVYFYKKMQLLRDMQCVDCQVKSNLERQVTRLEKYVNLYLWAGTLIPAVFILYLGFLLYIKIPHDEPRNIFLHSPAYAAWQTALAWLASVGISVIFFYFLNRKYIRWLYGNHIRHLKGLLLQMKDEPDDNDGLR